MPDLSEQIEDAAGNPKKVQSDAGSAEAHPLPDLIAADRYLKSNDAQEQPHKGIRFHKWRPPGAV